MTEAADAPLRVGIVGYGLAGRVFHGRLIAAVPELVVAGIVTGNAERAGDAARDHPGAAVVPDLPMLLREVRPELVVIASPTGAHLEGAKTALEGGAAVVVDKPLALDGAAANALVDLATGRLLTVFQNRRWDSDFLTVRRLLADGVLGEVTRYESRFERWRPSLTPGKWREALPASEGGGVLMDLGPHIVDQAVVLNGAVSSVYAELASRRGAGDDDAFVALTHDSGATSHLWASAVAAAPGPRLRILGSEAAYVSEALDSQEDQLRAGLSPSDPAFGIEPSKHWGRVVRGASSDLVESERGAWSSFYPAVAAALRGTAEMPVDPAESAYVLTVLDAARLSAEQGRVIAL